jgi:hypothetical protein
VRVPQNVVDTLASFSCPVMMMMLLQIHAEDDGDDGTLASC